ncbi:hypothetical protein SCOR_13265 [Sulfidibacter corallicola]
MKRLELDRKRRATSPKRTLPSIDKAFFTTYSGSNAGLISSRPSLAGPRRRRPDHDIAALFHH